jgi:hypothetical protein
MCPRQSAARFFSARLHMTNVARFREHSMRARKKLLVSCSLLKETIFRRGLDADRGIGDIVHRYLASRLRIVFLLTTESVFQGCSGLFLNGSLPRHARCASRGFFPQRGYQARCWMAQYPHRRETFALIEPFICSHRAIQMSQSGSCLCNEMRWKRGDKHAASVPVTE